MNKKFFFVALAGMLLAATSCNDAVNVDQFLQNENTRQQVFEKIADDHEMMTGFIGVLMNSEHAKMMMKGHEGMTDVLVDKGKMIQMMKNEPEMMHDMMKDGKVMTHMIQMMNEEGMMSEDCMQSCMEMMGDTGMGSMGENDNGDNHESHSH